MKQTSPPNLASNQAGFTLIELIMVIVILGILAVVAIPKYADLQTEAAEASASGVYGAAQAACAINFATGLLKPAANQPAGGPITDGASLLKGMNGTPDGWAASGTDIAATVAGKTYTISVTAGETSSTKCVLSKSW